MDFHFDIETVVKVLLALVAAGVFVTKLVDALKAKGTIKPEQAGEYNQLIAFIVALATFVIRWFGFEDGLPGAEQLGVEISAILVTTYTVAVAAKLMHKLVNWLEGRKRHDSPPLVQTPVG